MRLYNLVEVIDKKITIVTENKNGRFLDIAIIDNFNEIMEIICHK